MPHVVHVNAFEDNYIWLIVDDSGRFCACVDPGDDEPVHAILAAHRLTLTAILITHHHRDHVGGIEDLRRDYPVPVYGPAHERIPAINHRLIEGDTVSLESLGVRLAVLDVPGHTAGHIAYWGEGWLFCGDTLFSAGCGRLFEGTAEQMHRSLGKFAALPDATAVFCAHEYTDDGLRFAAAVEPGNADVTAHRQWVSTTRRQDKPTLPSRIGLEKRINPFLRVHHPQVRAAVTHYCGRAPDTDSEVFRELRLWKDAFRG